MYKIKKIDASQLWLDANIRCATRRNETTNTHTQGDCPLLEKRGEGEGGQKKYTSA